MKIVTAAQMRAADRESFELFGRDSLTVMENAGRAVFDVLRACYSEQIQKGVTVFVGGGNNGGDGYVASRLLHTQGIPVTILGLKAADALSGDALIHAQRAMHAGVSVIDCSNDNALEQLATAPYAQAGVFVDALFGTGFHGQLSGVVRIATKFLNEAAKKHHIPVVAIDIPTGVDATTGEVSEDAVTADATVTLQCLKLGLVLFPATRYCGDIFVKDIGLASECPALSRVNCFLSEEDQIREFLRRLGMFRADAHKGKRGHVLVVGGSRGHFGAVRLSGLAALCCGAGLLTAITPQSGVEAIVGQDPELMVFGFPESLVGALSGECSEELSQHIAGKDSVVLGPGLSQGKGSLRFVEETFKCCALANIPLVIDADALNILSANPELWKLVPMNSILTPHPGEMAKLVGSSISEIERDRITAARELSAARRVSVVLKGARTVIAHPDETVWINPTSCAVLATAGSGDVLSGVIAAMLASGIAPADAARAGVFVHGRAGERLYRKQQGVAGASASDIVRSAGAAINEIVQNAERDTEAKISPALWAVQDEISCDGGKS